MREESLKNSTDAIQLGPLPTEIHLDHDPSGHFFRVIYLPFCPQPKPFQRLT